MTYKKNTYGHQLGPMTHFLRYHTFDSLLSFEPKMLRTHVFITFPGKKEVKLEKIQKKAVAGINCGP